MNDSLRLARRARVATLLAAAGFCVCASITSAAPVKPAKTVANPCTLQTVAIATTMPTQLLSAGNQVNADCVAWQEFIYLNWRADPKTHGLPDPAAGAAQFGDPTDKAAKVWESYVQASQVFHAKASASWAALPRSMTLSSLSEVNNIALNSFGQAGNGKWLTDQYRGLAYYDVRFNQDEFEFIQNNNLITFAGQAACAQGAGTPDSGFQLPGGSGYDHDCTGKKAVYGQNVGTIEIKAAWVVLPKDKKLQGRYLTTTATITDPQGKTTTATVGLVGLHIIHKMASAPQFVWATFEQIDNDPDLVGTNVQPPNLPANHPALLGTYTFYNIHCDPKTDHYGCVLNREPGTPCDKTHTTKCDPYDAPVQVARVTGVDSDANNATGYVWSLLSKNSIFKYYRLIDVQWPAAASDLGPKPPYMTPLTKGGISPDNRNAIVANTTLETYEQKSAACMDCHQGAPIAQKPAGVSARTTSGLPVVLLNLPATKSSPDSKPASDYSFVFKSETTH